MTRYYRVVLGFLVSFMLGILTISTGRWVGDQATGDDSNVVHLNRTEAK